MYVFDKLFLILLTAACTGWAAYPMPYDHVLIAYELSPAQEERFSLTDAAVSPFWADWDINELDYLLMTPDSNGVHWRGDPWSGAQDGRIMTRAAFSDRGVFLLAKIADDDFVLPRPGNNSDNFDVHIDSRSSAHIYDGGTALQVYCFPEWWQVTKTSVMLSVPVGDTGRPDYFNHLYCENAGMNGTEELQVTLEHARQYRDGLGFELMQTSETTKVLEWYIPWSQVGAEGMHDPPYAGARLAFSCVYYDSDDSVSSEGVQKALLWVDKRFPFTPPDSGRGWGDLQLSECCPRPEPWLPASSTLHPTALAGGVHPGAEERYTLRGRRLDAAAGRRGTKVAVVRTIGSSVARIRMLPAPRTNPGELRR